MSAPSDASSPSAAPSALAVNGALFAVQVAFASLSVAGRVALTELPPLALALLRLAGASLVFVPLYLVSGRRNVPWRDVLGIAGCAALGIFGNQALFLSGLRYTTATHATLLVATIPIFAAVAAVVLGRERFRARTGLGVLVAFLGIAFLVGTEGLAAGPEAVLGDLLVLGNSVVYALYLVLVREYAAKYGSAAVVAWGFAAGTLYALPFGGPDLAATLPSLGAGTWLLLLYIVLVPTVFTYLTNAWALRHASSSNVAVWIYAQPTVAAALAWWILDETPTVRLGVATLLVFAGIAIVTLGAPPAAPLDPRRP